MPSSDFTVDGAGQITCKGQAVGKLQVVTPIKPRPLGNSCFAAAGATAATGYTVHQSMVEQANVNPVQEMSRMMEGYRFYEANATALRYQDETLTTLMRIVQ
jgi:flagellar basal body rod protein FlgG